MLRRRFKIKASGNITTTIGAMLPASLILINNPNIKARHSKALKTRESHKKKKPIYVLMLNSQVMLFFFNILFNSKLHVIFGCL